MERSAMQMLIDFYLKCGIAVAMQPTGDGWIIEIKVGMTEKIQGYEGFETHFLFDKEGNFISQTIWE